MPEVRCPQKRCVWRGEDGWCECDEAVELGLVKAPGALAGWMECDMYEEK